MFFRFLAGLLLAVAVALAGVWLEKENLRQRRLAREQQLKTHHLLEERAKLRTKAERLRAPSRTWQP